MTPLSEVYSTALDIPYGVFFWSPEWEAPLCRIQQGDENSPQCDDEDSVGMGLHAADYSNWEHMSLTELYLWGQSVTLAKPASDPDLDHMRALAGHTEAVASGGSSSYYVCEVTHVTTPQNKPYFAECNDIIVALKMKFGQGNIFKAIWRYCAEQNLGKVKANNESIRDLDKIIFFAEQEKRRLQAEIDATKA